MDNDSAFAGMFSIVGVLMMLTWLASVGFGVYMYMRIARKAGWPASYGLLAFIPVANVVIMVMFVFAEWPVERERNALRAQLGGGYPPQLGGGGYPPQAGGGAYPPQVDGGAYPPQVDGGAYPPQVDGGAYPLQY